MTTTYRVPVADELLAMAETWRDVPGFRLVSRDGPWLAHPGVTICTFEDDAAPAFFEGKLVEPILHSDGDGEHPRVVGRVLVNAG